MTETIETVISCLQQSFEIAGALNPVQIKIEDDSFKYVKQNIKMRDIV